MLKGCKALVTSGPTREAIDPVRYLTNRSSGKQGHAIAAALAAAGAAVTLVAGPVNLSPPPGVTVVSVESAQEMLAACLAALPVDIAVCAAAVADWRTKETSLSKLKKREGEDNLTLTLIKNPDILAALSHSPLRPRLLVGFAAETEDVVAHAREKKHRKQCDWIIANEVGKEESGFETETNKIWLITGTEEEEWPLLTKEKVAQRLVAKMAEVDSLKNAYIRQMYQR